MNSSIFQKSLRILALLLVVWLLIDNSAWACPTCKDGVQHGENAARLVSGYFWSIVFMMAMPFTIFSFIGVYFYLQVRKARAGKVAKPESLPAEPRLPELAVES